VRFCTFASGASWDCAHIGHYRRRVKRCLIHTWNSEIEFGKDAALCSECVFGDDDVASETNSERAHFKAILIASENRLRDISAACARRIT
jgi:hypothetical protein